MLRFLRSNSTDAVSFTTSRFGMPSSKKSPEISIKSTLREIHFLIAVLKISISRFSMPGIVGCAPR